MAANIVLIQPDDAGAQEGFNTFVSFLEVYGRHSVTRIAGSDIADETAVQNLEGTTDLFVVTSWSGGGAAGRNEALKTTAVPVVSMDVQPTRLFHDEQSDQGAGGGGGELTHLKIVDNTHYITAGYTVDQQVQIHKVGNSTLGILPSDVSLAGGATILASPVNPGAPVEETWGSIIAAEAGSAMHDGAISAGRKVFIWPHLGGGWNDPATNHDAYSDNFTNEAKQLVQRSINWALGYDTNHIYYSDVKRESAAQIPTSDLVIPYFQGRGMGVEIYDSALEFDANVITNGDYDLFFLPSHTGTSITDAYVGGTAAGDGIEQEALMNVLVTSGAAIMNCEINPHVYFWRVGFPTSDEFKVSNDDINTNPDTHHQFSITDPDHFITTAGGLDFEAGAVVDVWSQTYGGVTITFDMVTPGDLSTPSSDIKIITKPHAPVSVLFGADANSLATIAVQESGTPVWNGTDLAARMAFFSLHSGDGSHSFLDDMTADGLQLFTNTLDWTLGLATPEPTPTPEPTATPAPAQQPVVQTSGRVMLEDDFRHNDPEERLMPAHNDPPAGHQELPFGNYDIAAGAQFGSVGAGWQTNQTVGDNRPQWDGNTNLSLPMDGQWDQYIDNRANDGTAVALDLTAGHTYDFVIVFTMPEGPGSESMGLTITGSHNDDTNIRVFNITNGDVSFSNRVFNADNDLATGQSVNLGQPQSLLMCIDDSDGDGTAAISLFYNDGVAKNTVTDIPSVGWVDITPASDPNGLLTYALPSSGADVGVNNRTAGDADDEFVIDYLLLVEDADKIPVELGSFLVE